MFKYPPVPLAMGSGLKLRELLGTEFKPTEIGAFLQAWTSGPRYLKPLLAARCGTISTAHRLACQRRSIAPMHKSG